MKILLPFLVLAQVSVFTSSQYTEKINQYKQINKNIEDIDFYNKKIKFKDKKTGKFIEFKNLSAFEQSVFLLTTLEEIVYKLEAVQTLWQKRLDNAPEDDGSLAKEDEAPKKANYEKFISDIKVIRKELIAKWEMRATYTFSKFRNKFTAKEQDFYLNRIKYIKGKAK